MSEPIRSSNSSWCWDEMKLFWTFKDVFMFLMNNSHKFNAAHLLKSFTFLKKLSFFPFHINFYISFSNLFGIYSDLFRNSDSPSSQELHLLLPIKCFRYHISIFSQWFFKTLNRIMSYCGFFLPFEVVIFGLCLVPQEGWMALRSLGLPGLRTRSSGGGALQGAASLFSPGPQWMWTVNLCWRIRCCRHMWVWKEEPQLCREAEGFHSNTSGYCPAFLWTRGMLCHVTFWPQVSVCALHPLVATAMTSSPASPRLVWADGSCCCSSVWWKTTAGQTGLRCCLSTWAKSTPPSLTCWVTSVLVFAKNSIKRVESPS